MVTCPPNVKPGQKIRFQLPVQLSQQQLEAIRVNYDKDGWMRCLGPDLKFHWMYNTSEKYSKTKVTHLIPFDIESTAFVRQLKQTGPSPDSCDITLIPASEYAIETTVTGTNVNYQELSSVSQLSFKQKTDWLKNQFTALRVPWEQGHIKIKLRRSSMLTDSMEAVESITPADMMKTFRFEFIGEPGLDAGGLAREFYQLVAESLFNPDFGLFLYSSVNQMCMQINPNSGIANEMHLKYFHFAGRVLGKALMDGHLPAVHLIQPLYKHLMGWPVMLHDLEHIDDQVYRNLVNLLDFDDVGSLYIDFSVSEDHLGVAETVNLIPGGADITVTNDNLASYLEAQLKYRLVDRVKNQLKEFLRGFYDVVPEPLLSVFDFQELELVLHGLPVIDMDDWMANTLYSGDFTNDPGNIVIVWFWDIVRNYDQEKKARLLQFATGTCGVPSQGFGFLQGNDGNIRKFCLHGDKNIKVFPRSHTCFNRLDMPIYTSKAEMQKFLTMAISLEASGFDIE
jgi:E3 ubiquitin-protein ligase NEDD4